MDALIFSLALAAIAAVAFLVAKSLDKRILFACALAAAVYIGADDFVTGLPSLVKGLKITGASWNWTGKFLSLALSATAIAALKFSPATVGLTVKQRHPKNGLVALLLLIVWGSCLGMLFKPGVPDTETILFQATMPSLSEELVYRGIVPTILLSLFCKQRGDDEMPWAVILSTAIVFGTWHGLKYSNGVFGFDALAALFPFIGSIPAGWMRFKTSSLLFPILAHSLANVAFHVAGGFAA